VAAAGVKVLKIHAHTQGFDIADPRVEALARRAGELGITVLMDNANILPGDSEKLFNLVVRVPKTNFILAHIGGLNFRFWNILALARTADGFGFENLYFDISATVLVVADSPVEEEFLWTLRNVGLDHVLLGSDYPQIGLDTTVEAFERLDLTADEKEDPQRQCDEAVRALTLAFRSPGKRSSPGAACSACADGTAPLIRLRKCACVFCVREGGTFTEVNARSNARRDGSLSPSS